MARLSHLIFLLPIFFWNCQAWASYFLLQLASSPLDPNQPVQIVVSGRGNDLGTAPQVAAAAKAKQLMTAFPGDQVLVISTNENHGDELFLKHLGYRSIRPVNKDLGSAELMNQLSKYHKIAGLYFYGHSGIGPGVFLDRPAGTDKDLKWAPNDPQSARLIGHFTPGAVVIFNGCNVGHEMAPQLSGLWRVPVAGALTSTHFEALYPDGKYYVSNTMLDCPKGVDSCYRMKPDNTDYYGVYGHYNQGLPFYKFFCDGVSRKQCLAGMAKSVIANVSAPLLPSHPNLTDYEAAVREWLCPSGIFGDSTQAECMAQLATIDPARMKANSSVHYYTPFESRGHTAQCDDDTCYPKCDLPDKSLCAEMSPPRQSTTFVDEYLDYIAGYHILFGDGDVSIQMPPMAGPANLIDFSQCKPPVQPSVPILDLMKKL